MGSLEDLTILSDFLSKKNEEFWTTWFHDYGLTDTLIVFSVFLLFFLLSNLFAFMIRIYNNSLPIVNVNIVNTINLYIVEITNISVTSVTGLGMWVCFVSHLPFALAYTVGLCQTLLGYMLGGLSGVVGILKLMIVLQVSVDWEAVLQIWIWIQSFWVTRIRIQIF